METIYRVGNKEFTNIEEAQKFENEEKERISKEEAKKKAKEIKWNEVVKSYENFKNLLDNYTNEYSDFYRIDEIKDHFNTKDTYNLFKYIF